jgi:predicted MFS family arabinose efflux permease
VKEAAAGLRGLAEGFRYVWRVRPIRFLLLNLSFIGVAGTPYVTLMPVFAKNILHGGPQTLGLLVASVGVGAMVGAAVLASRRRQRGLSGLVAFFMVIYSLGLIAFSRSAWLPLSMGVVLFTGLGMMMVMASTNTLIQTLADDDKRGRVMALYTMSFMGAGPVGSLWAGWAAKHIGAPLTVWIGGVACLIAALVFLGRLGPMRRDIRPIYDAKGIV